MNKIYYFRSSGKGTVRSWELYLKQITVVRQQLEGDSKTASEELLRLTDQMISKCEHYLYGEIGSTESLFEMLNLSVALYKLLHDSLMVDAKALDIEYITQLLSDLETLINQGLVYHSRYLENMPFPDRDP